MFRLPERIVCLTEETTETLYLLEEDWRIVGISGFTVRPAQARKEKPKVSAFTSARIDKILALEPDLVLGFSDLQADIAAELIRQGVEVHVFNHRSVDGILRMMRCLGGMIGCEDKAARLVAKMQASVDAVRGKAAALPARPRVYFEEWDNPMISGIRWVSELIEIAGGEDCFPELREKALAKDRIIAEHATVVARRPDIILGSWCGKKFQTNAIRSRPGFDITPAVRNGELHEIKSPVILQPGPAALTEGLGQIHAIVAGWCDRRR